MNQRIESAEAQAGTVSVWTPWGEQKVLRSDARFLAQRLAVKRQRGEDLAPALAAAADWTVGRG